MWSRAGEVDRSETMSARRRRCVDDQRLRLRVAVADVDVADIVSLQSTSPTLLNTNHSFITPVFVSSNISFLPRDAVLCTLSNGDIADDLE